MNVKNKPGITITGGGKLVKRDEEIMPEINCNKFSDASLYGEINIKGTNTDYLMFSGVNFEDVEVHISGSYERIAFVNCRFSKESVITIKEETVDTPKEILLMGCDHETPPYELILASDEKEELSWKQMNVWVYGDTVMAHEIEDVEDYISGHLEEEDFEEEFPTYNILPDNYEEEEVENKEFKEEDVNDISWKVSLAAMGASALLGALSNKEVVHEQESYQTH